MINDMFECISTAACNLMYYRKRCTLTPEDIEKAVYLLLPEKLAKYAVAFGKESSGFPLANHYDLPGSQIGIWCISGSSRVCAGIS